MYQAKKKTNPRKPNCTLTVSERDGIGVLLKKIQGKVMVTAVGFRFFCNPITNFS